jgi:hypothetical protein
MKIRPSRKVLMPKRRHHPRFVVPLLILVASVLAGPLQVRAEEKSGFALGAGFDRLSRTISWDGGDNLSKLKSNLFTLQGNFRFSEGFGLSLKAGLSLPSFNGLVFRDLPVSIEYGAGPAEALALGAEIWGVLLRTGEIEIEGIARTVSSIGLTKTWPLEGFAVDGEIRGRQTWFEAVAGARITSTFFGRLRPYLLIAGDFLRGSFKVDEALEDLVGSETKKIKGKSAIFTAFGASFEISPRLTVVAEAALLPYPGGIDSCLSIGIFRVF